MTAHTWPQVRPTDVQDLLQLILPQREWEKEQKCVPVLTWLVWAQGKAGVNSQLESVPQPLMSVDLHWRIANLSIFGSHAASLWLCRCDRFPVESQLLSLSRVTEQIPARVKPWKMGQATALPLAHRTAELPGSCVSCAKTASTESGPSKYSSLGNVWNEPGWPEEAAQAVDCDLCLLPGACKFSIPHIDSSSGLQSQEIKIPARFLELSAWDSKTEPGKQRLFGAHRNPSQIHVFS